MSCPPESLHGIYVDGELAAEELREVESHLVGCERCRATVLALRSEASLVSDVLHERPHRDRAPVPVPAARGLAVGFPLSLLLAIGVATSLGFLLEARLPSGTDWLSPSRLIGVNEMLFDFFFALRARAPGLVEFFVAVGVTASLATLGSFLAGALLRRFARAVTLALVLLGAMLAPPPAEARIELRLDQDVHVAEGETLAGTLVVTGDSLRIDGVVEGDVFAFSESLAIHGRVEGNVFAGAKEVELTGEVGRGLHVGGETVRVQGRVVGNAYVGCDRFLLAPEGQIDGDLTAGAERVVVEGRVGRDLTAGAERIELAGQVGRDVASWAERVVVLAAAVVGGDLDARVPDEDHLQIDSGATVAGKVQTLELHHGRTSLFERYAHAGFYLWLLVEVAAAFLVGLLLQAFVPGIFRGSLPSGRDFLVSFGVGFAALVLVPLSLALVALTLIGIPAALIGLGLYLAALYVADISVAVLIGRSLLHPASEDLRDFGVALLVGLLIVVVLCNLPWLGWPARLVVLLVGLGLLVSRGREALRERRLAA